VLGQIAYADFQGSKECETYHFDVMVGLRRDEVKTKLRSVRAEGNHNATVAAANCTQDCDRLRFASLYPDRRDIRGRVDGLDDALAFFQAAELRRKARTTPRAWAGRSRRTATTCLTPCSCQ